MNTNILKVTAMVFVVALIATFLVINTGKSKNTDEFPEPDKLGSVSLVGQKAVVYKSPSCGCCAVYASYLKREGLSVEVVNTDDMQAVKEENNIPQELASCHTTIVGGYVVEGHIPVEAIARLLTESPDIKGIAMPGMPVGSPGMPGAKQFPFEIYKLGAEGLFMTI
jgi:hypothetical protein